MDIGVFIPIGNNGWLISTQSPQYMPSFELNKQIVQKAEKYGLDFALSMIKLRGFGGKAEFWDYNLESFTLMAALPPSQSVSSSLHRRPCSPCRRQSSRAWRPPSTTSRPAASA